MTYTPDHTHDWRLHHIYMGKQTIDGQPAEWTPRVNDPETEVWYCTICRWIDIRPFASVVPSGMHA